MKVLRVGSAVAVAAVAAVVGLSAAFLAARGAPGPMDDPSVGLLGDVPSSLLDAPPPPGRGLGVTDRDVASPSPAAAALYRQGRAWLAGFAWVPAARSFNAALVLDPDLAAARAGLARAYLGLESISDAVTQAEAAVELATRRPLPETEHRWVELARLQMAAVAAGGRQRQRRFAIYLGVLDRAVAATPYDPDLLVLRGNAAAPAADGWGQAGGEEAIRWYRRALTVAPDFPPAHHYLTHALENLGRGIEALDHARAYARLAPAIPHAHHMVAHVAPRAGCWHEALAELEEADRLHREAFAAENLPPESDWHFGHNLRVLATVELHLGLDAEAERHFAESFAIPYHGRRAGFYCLSWGEYLLSRGRFAQAGEVAARCSARGTVFARLVGATLGGEVALAEDRVTDAEAALGTARRVDRELRRTARPLLGERVFLVTADRQLAILAGKLQLVRDGDSPLLLQVAESLTASPTLDGWTGSVLRLKELVATAERRGAAALADRLKELRRSGASGAAFAADPGRDPASCAG